MEIHCIKYNRNLKETFDLKWTIYPIYNFNLTCQNWIHPRWYWVTASTLHLIMNEHIPPPSSLWDNENTMTISSLSRLFSSRVVPVLILELFSNYNYQGVSFNLLHLFPIPWWHYSTLSKLWSQIKNKWQIKRLFPLYCLPCWCWYKLEGPKKVFIKKNMLTSSKRPTLSKKVFSIEVKICD